MINLLLKHILLMCQNFDTLVLDGQIIVPPGSKNQPLEYKQKRGLCKYHNFLGHNNSQCFMKFRLSDLGCPKRCRDIGSDFNNGKV